VIGPLVRLRSRSLYSCIAGRASWEAPVKVNADVLNELIFWKENLSEMNVCSLDHVFSNENADVSVDVYNHANVFVDASGTGFGGFIEGVEQIKILGCWKDIEANLSSTWRE
jgi:hypothetical protein